MFEILVLALFAVPAGMLYWVDRVRRRAALERWSANHGYKLLAFRQPLLTEASGFPLSVSKSQQVFHIDVATPEGKRRSGWIRLGTAWFGLASNHVDLRWDIEEPPTRR